VGSCLTLSLGLLLARARQSNEALEKLALEPKSGAALLASGCILQERNDLAAALGRYRIAAFLIPESAALWNNVGMCFLKKQKYVAVRNNILKTPFFYTFWLLRNIKTFI